ncbi:MAG: hypothetical protein Q4C13_06905 [Clostridia bacterium]|nr:hypothetical protein [Clostridia bacterium]
MFQTGNPQEALLLYLQEQAGCRYLSDLHDASFCQQVRRAVEAAAVEKYSLEEWNDALQYITCTEEACGSAAETKARLLLRLDQKKR